MGKPVERQNHSVAFFILAMLIAICTAWAFYEEYLGRRPWKDFQTQIFKYEQKKAQADLRYFERRLEAGDLKVVVDPAHPDATMTVAEARARLAELDKNLAEQRAELARLDDELKQARIRASDADLEVKYLRSEDDGLFYAYQNAQHEEALARAHAAKLKAAGDADGAARALAEADRHKKQFDELTGQRQRKAQQIRDAERSAQEAAGALAALEAQRAARVGERERLKVAIDGALDPVVSAKTQLELASKKSTELTQYWLTSYDNSVDRCQNCHATIDRCGFSRPHELVEAAGAPDAVAEKVAQDFCVNPDQLQSYVDAAAELCGVTFDPAASSQGSIEQGQCFTGEQRALVGQFVRDYCGAGAPALQVLADRGLKAACVGADGWTVLARYVRDPKQAGLCELPLGAEGEACVEGARRDHLALQLADACGAGSPAVRALQQQGAGAKACASGEGAKTLAEWRPLLYTYPVWAQTHPYRARLLGANHPPDKYGCTSCHEGQGSQTKGVAGHPFQHGYDDPYWERPMLDLVAHKKFRPQHWGPPATSEGVPGTWVTHQDHFVEATCAKCHTEDIALPFAPTYSRGRQLVAEIGCHGCHPVDAFRDFPKLGPTLTDLKQKTTPGFLTTWIAYPKSFRPRTKMPNFWPEALDGQLRLRAGSAEHQLRTDQVRKIAAYLWKTSQPAHLPEIPVKGDVARGKRIVQEVGCRGCHNFSPPAELCTPEQIAAEKHRGTVDQPGACEVARSLSGSTARDFAPNLSNVGLKTNERWLFSWVKDPQSLWKQSRMPNLRLSDQEAADVASYLMTLKAGEPPAEDPFFQNEDAPAFAAAAEEGSKLISYYGCAGCHDIAGHLEDPKIGTDLNEYGRKTVDLLDFGDAIPNPRHHSWYNFVDLKLRAPRSYRYERVDTRMPQFDMTDDEVEALMTFLKSRTADKVPPSFLVATNERRSAIARGDQQLAYFNCRGCHVIDGSGGDVRDVYLVDDLWRAPPILQMQGWRVQPDWFFGFLHDPSQKLRPWLNIRMPTFPLGDERATQVIRSFAARANVSYPYLTVSPKKLEGKEFADAKALFEELRCLSCHNEGEIRADQDPASMAPNLRLGTERLRPDWVVAWLWNPQALQEGTRMPSFFTPDDKSTVMYPNYFGGDQARQIEALRDYVMSLGAGSGPQVSRK